PRLEEMIRRDPLSPWMRVALATAVKSTDAARADALVGEAADVRTDWIDEFRLSACLERTGERAPAQHAYEHAYQDFLAERNDPRMMTVLISKLIIYGAATANLKNPPEDDFERTYRVTPWPAGAAV